MYRVAVIGGQPHAVQVAKEHGIEVVLVHEEGKYEEEFHRYCEQIIHAPITDAAALLAVLKPLHERRPFDRVLSTSEDGAIATGEVVEALGLPGTRAATARALKDKALTRRLLAQRGLSPVQYRVVRSEADALEFFESIGDRVVIKPVDGVASIQIHVAESADDVRAAWKLLAEAGHSAALAEEYLDGPVVSVDSFSFEGRHLPIGMSEYRMNDLFVEWEVSTPSRYAAPVRPQLRELTGQLLDAVGLTDGPAHSEFVLTPNGPRVLESHNRLAGSGAPELVRRAFGPALSRMFLTVPLGIERLPATPPDPVGGAAVRFFTPEPGLITDISGVEQLDAKVIRLAPGTVIPNIVPHLNELTDAEVGVVIAKGVGDTVPPLVSVAACTTGYVIASGRDADHAVARCDEVAARIQFHTKGA
ncbi:MAG TPA: ATP-grasp domain-containing protein [Rugosimonospora sp.]|nr:ATP-grasp domain-containing protein [Rugosimonospora sp.]